MNTVVMIISPLMAAYVVYFSGVPISFQPAVNVIDQESSTCR